MRRFFFMFMVYIVAIVTAKAQSVLNELPANVAGEHITCLPHTLASRCVTPQISGKIDAGAIELIVTLHVGALPCCLYDNTPAACCALTTVQLPAAFADEAELFQYMRDAYAPGCDAEEVYIIIENIFIP